MISYFVITTIYNTNLSALKKTCNSLLQQTECNFIHYLYDDGSNIKDDELDIFIKNYSSTDKYKVIYTKCSERHGVDRAHMDAISKCSCDYFIWLDSGDFLSNDFFEKTTKIIKHTKWHISWLHYSSFEYFENNCHKKTGYFFRNRKKNQFYQYCFSSNCYYFTFVVNFNDYKNLNQNFRFIDYPKHNGYWYDAQICFLMALNHLKMKFVNETKSYIYKDPKSVSRQPNLILKRDNWNFVKSEIIDFSTNKNDRYIKKYKRIIDLYNFNVDIKRRCQTQPKLESIYLIFKIFFYKFAIPNYFRKSSYLIYIIIYTIFYRRNIKK